MTTPPGRVRPAAITDGVADAVGRYLADRPRELEELFHDAVKKATTEWLDRHGHELINNGGNK